MATTDGLTMQWRRSKETFAGDSDWPRTPLCKPIIIRAADAIEDEIALTVTDRGVGFDAHEPSVRASLGLTSMRERVRLGSGQVSVHSKRGEGTRIEARVPLRSGN